MSLFVTDEDIDDPMGESVVLDDDPVVDEIPVLYNPYSQSDIYLLQFPNKSSASEFVKDEVSSISTCRMKPHSGMLEVEVPVDTSRFFDAEKSEKWFNVKTQTLSGVTSDAHGYCAGRMVDGSLQLYPIAKTMQLRPTFKYIDNFKSARSDSIRAQSMDASMQDKDARKRDIQVVQMSMKTVGDNVPRLGGALQSKKREEEEPYEVYEFRRQGDEATVRVLDNLKDVRSVDLQLATNKDEYFTKLLA